MRILYFSEDYTTHDWRFLAGLAAGGHDVHFLRLHDPQRRFETRPFPDGVTEVPGLALPPGAAHDPAALLARMPEFQAVLDRVRPDVLQAGPVLSCGAMAAWSGFHPWLLVSWGSDILAHAHLTALNTWIARLALRSAEAFLCDCDAVRERAGQYHPVPPDRVIQFPWGIDPQVFRPGPKPARLRQRPGWEHGFVLLSTRSWEPIYDPLTLLRALLLAREREPRLRLLMAGDGSLAAEVRAFIAQENLTDVVHLPGRIAYPELPEWFRAADAYATATVSDGSSISLLEAMGTALPVVVTDNPGNREWVTPGAHGWLAPAGDARAFAEAFVRVAALDAAQRSDIGERNRAVVLERADWSRNFPRLLNAYAALNSSPPHGHSH